VECDVANKKYEEAAKKPKSGLMALKTLVTGKDAVERIQKVVVANVSCKENTKEKAGS
jgi:hypothetical protein